MTHILGVEVSPGDRLVVHISTGARLLGTYVNQHDGKTELGPTVDDHLVIKSVCYTDQIVGLQILERSSRGS